MHYIFAKHHFEHKHDTLFSFQLLNTTAEKKRGQIILILDHLNIISVRLSYVLSHTKGWGQLDHEFNWLKNSELTISFEIRNFEGVISRFGRTCINFDYIFMLISDSRSPKERNVFDTTTTMALKSLHLNFGAFISWEYYNKYFKAIYFQCTSVKIKS